MTVRVRRISSAVLAVMLLGPLLSCNKSTTIPTATPVTEDRSGTIQVGGSDNKTFTVDYAYAPTDASLLLKSVTSAATGAALNIPIGLGFGNFNTFNSTCVVVSSATNVSFKVGDSHGTQGGAFSPGPYCVSAFDPALQGGPALPEAVNYTYSITHN